ncbi:Fc.00g010090.m01.CDS01 [Cosmosporella sp. VM-42]
MGSIPQNGTPHVSLESLNFGNGIRVAVVGAGVSGICAGAHLLRQGANVTVFERSGVSSGVWHFDPRITNSPAYPSETPSVGDYVRSIPGEPSSDPVELALKRGDVRRPFANSERDALEIAFSPPGPCYAGLKNNVPTTLLYSSLGTWPPGTEDITGHLNIENYLRTLSAENGVDDVTQFHTRVEDATKSADGSKWIVKTITLLPGDGVPPVVERRWEFDALVIASGHYNLPRVPDVPGLTEWKRLFGDRVIHSKEYRHAETYQDKNIFIIGGGTSALDVCRETHEVAKSITQSTRGGDFDLPKALLPPSAQRVGGIEKFAPNPEVSTETRLDPLAPIPGQIILKDGQVLKDIDNVIVATGYITSYPFLSQFHFDDKDLEEAGPETLVTADGNMVHNLYKDIFYIEDPSLSFIGVPYHNATFSLFDFQAQAVARVLTGKSGIPKRETMRQEYDKLLATKGLGRKFHSLAEEGAEVAYVKDLVDWVNGDAVGSKLEPMVGHSEEWIDIYKKAKELRALIRKGNGDESFAPSWP